MFSNSKEITFPIFCDDCRVKIAKILSIEPSDHYEKLDTSWTVIAAFPEFAETQRLSYITCNVDNNYYNVTVRFDDSVSNSVIDTILYNMSAVDFRTMIESTVCEYLHNMK